MEHKRASHVGRLVRDSIILDLGCGTGANIQYLAERDKHPEVEFVQIQLNYTDWNNQISRSGELYEILHGRNIPIIVMEPVKGGILWQILHQRLTVS